MGERSNMKKKAEWSEGREEKTSVARTILLTVWLMVKYGFSLMEILLWIGGKRSFKSKTIFFAELAA